MATRMFPIEPQPIPPVKTDYRNIQTPLPTPEAAQVLQRLRAAEPRSMGGQPPILWDRGEGSQVFDAQGNCWIDFSSGVLVTSSGHGHRQIVRAITEMAQHGLYHAYCFPTDVRARLVEEILRWAPTDLSRVFLLTTGSEAVEACIKLARTWGRKQAGLEKRVIVSFTHGFHGRTMASQLAGGAPALKEWLEPLPADFVQVPFPDGFRQEDTSFAAFEAALAEKQIAPEQVCAVLGETFQGVNARLMPAEYAQALREWCDANGALLVFDEIQAGFGRTGMNFGFEHLDVVPDLVACGKGISGGMPLSAVIGREEIMDLYGPGEMTSTHSANPICSAAALANLESLRLGNIVEHVASLAPVLADGAARIAAHANGRVGQWDAVGLVAALQFTRPGTTEPDPDIAWEIVRESFHQGVLLFAPVGVGGCAVKLCPPLIIEEAPLREGFETLEAIVRERCAA